MAEMEEEYPVYEKEDLLSFIENKRLYDLLAEVDDITMRAILLKEMGFTIQEIARCLKITPKTLYCRIDRLRLKMRKFL